MGAPIYGVTANFKDRFSGGDPQLPGTRRTLGRGGRPVMRVCGNAMRGKWVSFSGGDRENADLRYASLEMTKGIVIERTNLPCEFSLRWQGLLLRVGKECGQKL